MVDRELITQEYYHGLLPREDLNMLLKKNGDFVVRCTEPKPGEQRQFVLSIMANELKEEDGIRHVVLRKTDKNKYAAKNYVFDTIPQLVAQFVKSHESVVQNANVPLVSAIGRQKWELNSEDVTLVKKLGEGAFGEVHMGELRTKNGKVKVAVKLAKLEVLTKEQIKEIMAEARLMRNFEHDNVVGFYGVSAGQEPLMVVMGLADKGALDSYLQKVEQPMSKKDEMIMQAAWGLEYIHSKNVLHRDIASRNCLYGDGRVKIADFGLSREGTIYTMDPHKKVPIRWLAPETIKTFVYSQKTDVWAFGVMAWEIYNCGAEPYPGMMVMEVARSVLEGYRLDIPLTVNPEITKIIKEKCWSEPNQRYTMHEVVKYLQRILQMKYVPLSNNAPSLQ